MSIPSLVRRYYGAMYFMRRLLQNIPRGPVLDVGSGHDPHPRAHVLCDKETGASPHRLSAPLFRDDRPLIIADVEALPFRDRSFSYVIASHVLEHVRHPDRAVQELSRVAQAGYIETPSVFAEKLHSSPAHRWHVRLEGENLVFTAKERLIFDDDLYRGWEFLYWKSLACWRLQRTRFADLFFVRVRWKGALATIVRGIPPNLETTISEDATGTASGGFWRTMLRRMAAGSGSFDVAPLLCCPVCRGQLLMERIEYTCMQCNRRYPVVAGVPHFLPVDSAGRSSTG